MGARFLHGFCTVGVFHVRLCRALYCIAISALFLRQPEPRCNTLDFAGKVVCQRGAGRQWRPAPLWKPKRNAHQLRCSSSASALIRLPMALTSGTTSAFPIMKSRVRPGSPAVQSSGKPLSRSHSMGVSVRRRCAYGTEKVFTDEYLSGLHSPQSNPSRGRGRYPVSVPERCGPLLRHH